MALPAQPGIRRLCSRNGYRMSVCVHSQEADRWGRPVHACDRTDQADGANRRIGRGQRVVMGGKIPSNYVEKAFFEAI